MRINNVKNQGFTLVEIAMVTVIFSLMMNLFGYGLLAYQKKQKYDETKRRLTVIEKALDEFLEINGRLPCVARADRRSGQAGFGAEVGANCLGLITGTGTFEPDAAPGLPNTLGGPRPPDPTNLSYTLLARVGSVPVRSLNLPDEYLSDAWGSRFTYVVSNRQASAGQYREGAGVINVVDTQGNSVIDQENSKFSNCPPPNGVNDCRNFAEYALISHGEDKKGGITPSNVVMPPVTLVPCPTVATEIQGENCTHINLNPNIVVSDVINDNSYDDIVRYKAGTNRNEILPSGAVIGFDSSVYNNGFGGGPIANNLAPPAGGFVCPVGWRTFEDARGRFIMGATAIGTPITRVERSNSITVSGGNRSYENLGQTEVSVGTDKDLEDAKVTVPPFVTTLFCEKQ